MVRLEANGELPPGFADSGVLVLHGATLPAHSGFALMDIALGPDHTLGVFLQYQAPNGGSMGFWLSRAGR